MTKKRSALGRGLGALLSDSNSGEKSNVGINQKPSTPSGSINEIPLEQVEVNPFQPRTDFNEEALSELADSIKLQGIIQPITVRQLSKDKYQLISGERRTQASRKAGLKTIPAYVRIANDQQMLEMALIENIQRENLNAIEIALSYQRLIAECNLKQEELGDRVGKNRTTVTNYLRLLKLPPDIQVGLRDGKISMGHAKAIIGVEEISRQLELYHRTLKEDLSVRQVEALARSLSGAGSTSGKQPTSSELNYEYKQLLSKLSSHFGSKISVKANDKHKGEIKIPFNSSDDLNRILEILGL